MAGLRASFGWRGIGFAIFLVLGGWEISGPHGDEYRAVSPEARLAILRYTVPLPKKMVSFDGLVQVDASRLVLTLPAGDDPLVEEVGLEFRTVFNELFGQDLALMYSESLSWQAVLHRETTQGEKLRLGPEMLAPLREVLTPADAYRIVTHRDPAGQWWGTVLAGVDRRGLLYAAKTFLQLARGVAAQVKSKAAVVLPVVDLEDWPDLPERGLWGGYALDQLDWLAERKLNLLEVHATTLTVDGQGRGQAALDPKIIGQARRYGIKLVPIVTHLDQLRRTGLFDRYPHVLGKGDPKKWPDWVDGPVCWAQPEARQVLTDWFCSLARVEHVEAITVWLSEAAVQCGCDICVKENQYLQETRAALAAWDQARQIKPTLELRILLTQGSYPVNDRVLAAVPGAVKIIYYDGGRTYTSSHLPMIEPRLEAFVEKGGWLGVCPQLTASWRIVSPFTGAHFIHARMSEFVTKRLRCLYGYATPSIRYWDFNVEAAAEWAWNNSGRTPREFAVSWAVRQGMADPEAVGEWSEILGPVAWDVYACGIPYPWFFGRVVQLIRGGTAVRPGEGPLSEINSGEQLADDLARAEKALGLARKMGHPKLIAESSVIVAYMEILSSLPEISEHLARVKKGQTALTAEERARLTALADRVKKAGGQLREALWAWARLCDPQVDKNPPPRFVDTVQVCEETADGIAEAIIAALQK